MSNIIETLEALSASIDIDNVVQMTAANRIREHFLHTSTAPGAEGGLIVVLGGEGGGVPFAEIHFDRYGNVVHCEPKAIRRAP